MQPLAHLLRPNTLEDYVGQTHLVGKGKPLSTLIQSGNVFSMIFWGPPGVGKTTLAKIIAHATDRDFIELSAVSAGKKDIQAVVDQTQHQKQLTQNYQAPVLFLDEIHRFNKAQQDFLLPHVETGRIILIGATTENPSFEVIAPLLSRTRVFVLKELAREDMSMIIDNAVKKISQMNDTLEAEEHAVVISDEAREWLITLANGDARQALTMIGNAFELYHDLSLKSLKNTLQSSHLRYDKKGEEHYNTISAFIKSMRASNVDASLYYLARMVDAGEDPKFIARRMVIFASEDIGLAQPTALVVANAVFDAVNKIGYPEAQITLAHGVAYLAQAKKDRSAHDAYFEALADVKKLGNLPIPMNLRNAPTKLMKQLDYGKGYEMYSKESLLPEELKNKRYLRLSSLPLGENTKRKPGK